LSLGTWLDVEIIEALINSKVKTLHDRWVEWDPKEQKTGKGVDRSFTSSQKYVDFLAELLVFVPPETGFAINYSALKQYGELFGKDANGHSCAHAPRRKELFLPPLVIVPEAPGDNVTEPRAYRARQPVSFSKSYYGYSCAGHPEAETLAALIYLLPHSTLFSYFCLMTSRRSGFDRQTFNKEEFDALPFPDLKKLSASIKQNICDLANRLEYEANKPWREINSMIFRLYGLDDNAVQVATDTLFGAVSYRRAGKEALKTTMRDKFDKEDPRATFITTLRGELEPYFDVCGEHVSVCAADFQPETWHEPWFFLAISREGDTVPVNPGLMAKAMAAANEKGASRITVRAPGKRGLLLGLLNQRRWWTITRARLCSQNIIRKHLGAFGLPEHT
jgi:hypothetical protein